MLRNPAPVSAAAAFAAPGAFPTTEAGIWEDFTVSAVISLNSFIWASVAGTGYTVRNEAIFLLVLADGLFGAGAELPVGGDTKLLLQLLDAIATRPLLEENQLVQPIAINVSGPATPSAVRPFFVCQSLRAFSVPGPKVPSASMPSFGLQPANRFA
jgi:hypothetical protein